MEIGHIIPHIEALVFASDRPLTPLDITELINNAFGFMEDKITLDQIEAALEGIVEKYRSEFYPFEMRESGGGWQFLTKKDFHKTVAQLNGEKFLKRLSTAALETLAIIAYKQPITKADIEAIRGVSSDYSIQKLLEKELIVITGRNEEMPGKPLVYATSKTFMDYFGLNSVEDLPKLKEIFDEAMVPPSVVPEGNNESAQEPDQDSDDESSIALIVSENGELIESDEALEGGSVDENASDAEDQTISNSESAPSEEGPDQTNNAFDDVDDLAAADESSAADDIETDSKDSRDDEHLSDDTSEPKNV